MNVLAHLRLQIEDFDDLPHRPVAAAPLRCTCARCAPEPRCHSETYESGLLAGRAQRRTADQDNAARLALDLSDALAAAEAQAAAIAEETAEAIGEAVIAMAAALLPASLAHLGRCEIRAIADTILPTLAHAPGISIDIAVDAAPDLRAAIDHLPVTQQSRVELRTHPRTGTGDISITWSSGAVHRNTAAILRRVEAILAELGLAPQTQKELTHG